MRLASIDVGLKRIGLAICLDFDIVIPQNPIIRKNRNQASKDISLFLKEWQIEKLIVGIPLGENSEIEMKKRIKHFINLLNFNGQIEFLDESFSSKEAYEMMKGNIKIKRDGKIDSISAKIILERYLMLKNQKLGYSF